MSDLTRGLTNPIADYVADLCEILRDPTDIKEYHGLIDVGELKNMFEEFVNTVSVPKTELTDSGIDFSETWFVGVLDSLPQLNERRNPELKLPASCYINIDSLNGFQPGKFNMLIRHPYPFPTRSFKSNLHFWMPESDIINDIKIPESGNMYVSPCNSRDAQVTYELMKSTLQEDTNN